MGSPTATPSIRPSASCSAAATAAPPPFDTLDAITRILPLSMLRWRVPLADTEPKRSLIAQIANSTACSVNLPQSFSGLRCECACLNASRCGLAAVKSASDVAPAGAANCAFLPAAARVVRVPSISGTVSVSRSCGAAPVPLSV
ncbi:hypothetical protein D3C81_1453060 [compost metagenome]